MIVIQMLAGGLKVGSGQSSGVCLLSFDLCGMMGDVIDLVVDFIDEICGASEPGVECGDHIGEACWGDDVATDGGENFNVGCALVHAGAEETCVDGVED